MDELKGSLEEKSVPEILLDAYIKGYTGILRLKKDGTVKNIFFQMGMPVYATSNDKNDRLGAYLTRIGKITRDDLTDALEISAETGKKLGEVLVEQGKLEPDELVDAVVSQIEEIIYSTFEWRGGTYEFIPEEMLDDDIIPLQISAANLIMEGIRKRFPMDELRRLVGGPNTVVALTKDPKYRFRELTLKKTEAQIISSIDGKRTVEEISQKFPGKEDIVYRTIGALLLMRTLVVVKKDEIPAEPEAAVTQPAATPSKEEKVATAATPQDPQKAKKLFELAKEFFKTGKEKEALELFQKSVELDPTRGEYFTGLGIALAADFPGHEPELEKALEMFDRAIQLEPEEARNYYYRGVVLKNLGRIEEARDSFLKALEINPDHKGAKVQLSKL